jgi:hypothetical protein
MKLIDLVKSLMYCLAINIIVFMCSIIEFMCSIIPFSSVKVDGPNGIEDISISFTTRYLLSNFLSHDLTEKKYQVHLKTFDKIFILTTNIPYLINHHNKIREISEKITPPRSLFIKYTVLINGFEVSIGDKVLYKKYAVGTRIVDMLKFNGIKLNNLKILKNDKEFKTWSTDFYDILVDDIYPFL